MPCPSGMDIIDKNAHNVLFYTKIVMKFTVLSIMCICVIEKLWSNCGQKCPTTDRQKMGIISPINLLKRHKNNQSHYSMCFAGNNTI